jgi:thioredoxin reductase (NADPH)
MAEQRHTKVLIIGAGPAGYTAAIYAARANLKPTLVTGMTPGGQLTITTDVENYPGFADVIQGPWLMDQMRAQAEHVGTEIVFDLITDVDVNARPFRATADSGVVYTADSIIICTGATARWLGLPAEEQLRGAGVSACATCDGFFFRGKTVAVIGGGNTAVEEALYLTNHASHVTLIHRRDSLRAEKILQDRLFGNPKVSVIWNHTVEDILSSGTPPTVSAVRLKSTRDALVQDIAVDGVFVAIGHVPQTELFKGKLALDSDGYLITAPDSTATNIPGVYAAGDVKDKHFRQAVTAAGMGCMAALEAEKFLASQVVRAEAAE